MAKGETTFSTGQAAAYRRDFSPFEPGDRDLKVLGDTAEIRRAKPSKRNPNPMPYVSFHLEALGTALEEGGKNRRVFPNLFTSLKKAKDGSPPMPMHVDQLTGFASALGKRPDFPIVVVDGQQCIDAKALKAWVQQQDGELVRAHVGIEKGRGEYEGKDKNIIVEYLAREEGPADEEPAVGGEAAAQLDDEEETL